MKNTALMPLAALLVSATCFTSPAYANNFGSRSASSPITVEEVREHIAVLASDAYEGRAPGTTGETKTLSYIAQKLAAAGFVSGTNDIQNPWYQPVPLLQRRPFAQTVQLVSENKIFPLDAEGVLLSGQSSMNSAYGGVMFVGHGINAEGKVNADVAGKVVILLPGEPQFDGATDLPSRRQRETMLTEAGAVAVLAIAPPNIEWGRIQAQRGSDSMQIDGGETRPAINGLLRGDVADVLLGLGKLDLAGADALGKDPNFTGRDLGATLQLASSDVVRRFNSYNVIGKLPGQRPGSGAIVLLGHWDHLGICRPEGEADRICNGAVDNASGISVLLTIADRLGKGPKLDRDIYVMGTTAEERGLLGAYYFADKPAVPLSDIVVALNIDTIAIAKADAPVAIIGRGKTSLDGEIEAVAKGLGRSIEPSEEANAFIRRQDGWALAAKSVPALMVGGSFADLNLLQEFLSSDYHGPGDELTDNTELGGATQDANLHVALTRHFANIDSHAGALAAKEIDSATGE